MAFPTTGVLDDFNRANGGLGANYTQEPFNDGTGGALVIASNAIRASAGSSYEGVWYNPATFGPDSEVYMDVVTANPAGFYILCLRILQPSNSASTGDGYFIQVDQGGPNLKFYRQDNGVSTQLGAADSVTAIASGDKWGVEMIGSTLTAYRYTAGAWAAYGATRSDGTYTTAGYLGFYIFEGSLVSVFDNFSGGTVVVASATRRMLASTGVGK